jgi:hypothetical protein
MQSPTGIQSLSTRSKPAGFFGSDDIGFTTESEDLPGVSRTFRSFSKAAMEAGMSRIYGGIHFMSANRNGLRSGSALGTCETQNCLLPKPGRNDIFDITLSNGCHAGGDLGGARPGGGNIQLHKCPPGWAK